MSIKKHMGKHWKKYALGASMAALAPEVAHRAVRHAADKEVDLSVDDKTDPDGTGREITKFVGRHDEGRTAVRSIKNNEHLNNVKEFVNKFRSKETIEHEKQLDEKTDKLLNKYELADKIRKYSPISRAADVISKK